MLGTIFFFFPFLINHCSASRAPFDDARRLRSSTVENHPPPTYFLFRFVLAHRPRRNCILLKVCCCASCVLVGREGPGELRMNYLQRNTLKNLENLLYPKVGKM